MKPLSPLAHPLGDESPALSMRDWLAGARPVAGTVAASALMLLVCGWFALGAGGLGQRHEVGQPSPVRLQANPAHTTRPAPHPRASTGHARADVGRRTTAPQRRSVSTAVHDAGAGNATTPTSYPIGRDSSTPAP